MLKTEPEEEEEEEEKVNKEGRAIPVQWISLELGRNREIRIEAGEETHRRSTAFICDMYFIYISRYSTCTGLLGVSNQRQGGKA